MKASFFKLEKDEELVDVMAIRVVERTEIEIFVLTQAIGLLEMLERKIMLTAQCKRSVLRHSIAGELEDMGSDEELLELLYRASELQGGLLDVSDEAAKEASELKEAMIQQLEIRVKKDWELRKEWEEYYRLDEKTLRSMHDQARAWIIDNDECNADCQCEG